jgi:HAD superfamily hydrolase (TIGR01484 family)
MRYRALATDYDGTIAHHGTVTAETAASLDALRHSGRKLLLVTGRELPDLQRVCPMLDLFDRCVVENGAVIYTPSTGHVRVLCEPPPKVLVDTLQARGVTPISVGHVIVATWEPHEKTVLEVIHDLGLELQVIFNKGAVMILPSGVNKASGLHEALNGLCLSPHNVVGVGDAENDHALLSLSECGVAVANAVPLLKQRADIVTNGRAGEGVSELIASMIADDLASFEPKLTRHRIALGDCETEHPATLGAYGETVLLTGVPEAGKAVAVTTLLETLGDRKYQFCVIDPKGDYADLEDLEHTVTVGDSDRTPSVEETMRLLEKPERHAVIALSAIAHAERPAFFQTLMTRLWDLRKRFGRPHWIVVNDAHLLMPAQPSGVPASSASPASPAASAALSAATATKPVASATLSSASGALSAAKERVRVAEADAPPRGEAASLPRLRGAVMVTSDLRQLAPGALEGVSTLVAAGPSALEALRAFCEARGVPEPALTLPEARADASSDARGDAAALNLDRDHAILWRPDSGDAPRIFRIGRCRESRR